MPVWVRVAGVWQQIAYNKASLKDTTWKSMLGGWYRTGGTWHQVFDGAPCSSAPTITGYADTITGVPCTTNTDWMQLQTDFTLSGTLGTFVIRLEVSNNGGSSWSLYSEGTNLTAYSGGSCLIGASGGSACTFQAAHRAIIKTSGGIECGSWTTGADTGVESGRAGRFITCEQ